MLKILIVDDDKFNLKLTEGYLKSFFENYLIETCQKPKLVMDLLLSKDFDIVLLDIMMPEISGIHLLKEIRKQASLQNLQIIMLTAVTDENILAECFELGANDYLKKPVSQMEFKARIKSAARLRLNTKTLYELYEKIKVQNLELKKLNKELKDTQFHLIQSEKLAAIGELAAGVAHEINNPLGYINSNLETMDNYLLKIEKFMTCFGDKMLSQDFLEVISKNELQMSIKESYQKNKIAFIMGDIKGLVEDLQSGVQKVSDIVRSLSSFARTGLENEKNKYLLSKIVEQVLLISKNEVKYVMKVQVDCLFNEEVYCNKNQISQVLLNIIVNAAHAVKTQQKTVLGNMLIKIFKEEGFSCISLKDDGPGIEQSNLNKIFNPFFTTKEVGQGTGLGLSISHDIIVKKHNGIIDVKSKEGQGTEFIIKLPFQEFA